MSTVTKHDITEIAGSRCSVNWPSEPLGIGQGEISRMVDMSMGQQRKINFRQRHRDLLIFILIRPLFHTTVYKKLLSCRLQKVAASGHLMGGTYKSHSHKKTPFAVLVYIILFYKISFSFRIYSGVVPQHPPTISAPASTRRFI